MKTPVEKANEIFHQICKFSICHNDALRCCIIVVNYIIELSNENNTNDDYDGQYYVDQKTHKIYGYNEYYLLVIEVFNRNIIKLDEVL